IFCANSHLTVEVLGLIREMNLKIPDDISFIGFDNPTLASLCTPSLTTVERDVYQLGVTAVEQLLAGIESKTRGPSKTLTLPMNLVIRESVAAQGADELARVGARHARR